MLVLVLDLLAREQGLVLAEMVLVRARIRVLDLSELRLTVA